MKKIPYWLAVIGGILFPILILLVFSKLIGPDFFTPFGYLMLFLVGAGGGLPLRPHPRQAPARLRRAGRAGGGGSDFAFRRTAGSVAAGSGSEERADLVQLSWPGLPGPSLRPV